MSFSTEQEKFWANEFGDDYISRNISEQLLASNVSYFAKALARTQKISSLIELGANVGMNISALKTLLPNSKMTAVEINQQAATELSNRHPDVDVRNESILDFQASTKWDLVFVKGVLIHLNPDALQSVYKMMASSSAKYVLIGEYYNPTPVSLMYRGHDNRLFKRDFAGEFMDANPDFVLLDYGFSYHRDPLFPQDDINWFLMEKVA
jgi:spore coat polysaccharide biosynthesis protein SpsF